MLVVVPVPQPLLEALLERFHRRCLVGGHAAGLGADDPVLAERVACQFGQLSRADAVAYPPSPRAITPGALATLVRDLRRHPVMEALFERPAPPLLVGVFVNESPLRMAETLDQCGLDLAQLSGDEDAASLMDPTSPIFGRGYKALRPRSIAEARAQISDYANINYNLVLPRPRILLDSSHGALYGGTGVTGDWAVAAELTAETAGLMLAGGLTPANVADAVMHVRPFAVDVAGGVEAAPGIKDHALIRSFIANAKSAIIE